MRSLLAILVALAVPAIAHEGRLDRSGCHKDKINGGYHCHRDDSGSTSRTSRLSITKQPDINKESFHNTTIYKWVDHAGVTHYTDSPPRNSQLNPKLRAVPLNSTPPPRTVAQANPNDIGPGITLGTRLVMSGYIRNEMCWVALEPSTSVEPVGYIKRGAAVDLVPAGADWMQIVFAPVRTIADQRPVQCTGCYIQRHHYTVKRPKFN